LLTIHFLNKLNILTKDLEVVTPYGRIHTLLILIGRCWQRRT